ncbi:MAG: glycosyltransferase family 2 protein [SAR324 cluster bacterium]|nr:glycosyltransferase family 2 protein [SAR324 cluster bacterium]
MKAKLSIIIPTYNSASLIERCLEALEQQTAPKADFEIIVVDDGSTDDSARVLQQYLQKTSLQLSVLHKPNEGPASARNFGVGAVQSDWIAFLDIDVVVIPEWVERGLKLMCNHPAAAGFEGCTEIGNQEKVTPFTHQTRNLTGGRYLSCNLILRKQFCQFSSAYKIPFREDTDLAFSILEAGYNIIFDSGLRAYHPPLSPQYGRPIRNAMRYYYDGLLERRFPARYENDVDVHYIGGIRIPHLRKKIYMTFIWTQMFFLCSLLFSFVPVGLKWATGSIHLLAFGVVILTHLSHVKRSELKWLDVGLLVGIAYFVPWILCIQRLRGVLAFQNEPKFSAANWEYAQPTPSVNQETRKIIPLHVHPQKLQEVRPVFHKKSYGHGGGS